MDFPLVWTEEDARREELEHEQEAIEFAELPPEEEGNESHAVTCEVMLRRKRVGENFVATHLLLSKSGEGATREAALADLVSVSRDYIQFLYEESGGDVNRWQEMTPLLILLFQTKGIEPWLTELQTEINEWLAENPST